MARDSRRKSALLEGHQAPMVGTARVKVACAALAVACAALGAGGASAFALDQQSLGDRIMGQGRRDVAPAARFACQAGPAFILDQSGPRALLRFEGTDEIWVLRPRAGPRGDIFYRNDVNEPVLRATRLGGVTLYTSDRPGGLPCALQGAAQPLRMGDYNLPRLANHLLREAARGFRALGHPLEIAAPEVDPGEEAVYAEAVTLAVDALQRASDNGGRQRASRVRTIRVVEGPSPGVAYAAGVLTLTIAPRLGVAGRPSSARVLQTILTS